MLQSFVSSVYHVLKGSDEPVETHITNDAAVCNSKHFTGVITNLYDSYGLIDEETYFPIAAFRGNIEPKVGIKVIVEAERKYDTGGWRAVKVHPTEEDEWEDEDTCRSKISDTAKGQSTEQTADTNTTRLDWDDEQYNASEEEEEFGNIGKVTSFSLNTMQGTIDTSYTFSAKDIAKENFVPYAGDWVSGIFLKSKFTSKCVNPLREMTFEGRISNFVVKHSKKYGYINREIFFWEEAVATHYYPQRGDYVSGRAVESTQRGDCKWRATVVEPVNMPEDFIPNTNKFHFYRSADQEDEPLLKDLYRDKGNIFITPKVDFGKMKCLQQKTKVVCAKNVGESAQTLISIYIRGSSHTSQIWIKDILYFDQHLQTTNSIIDKLRTPRQNRGFWLKPNDSVNVKLMVQAKKAIQEKKVLIFVFGGFTIGRKITVDVTQELWELNNEISETRNKWVIPGIKPHRGGCNVSLPNKLPVYKVPADLRYCVHHEDDVLDVCPALSEQLNMNNYSKRFSTLLHLEEIQMEKDIREFDLEHVTLRKVGESLGLQVPGLAEGRPSVLVGDSVLLCEPECSFNSPVWEGIVHEVLGEEVLLRFKDQFHLQYNNEEYNVEFTFGRTPLRRCQQAVNFAVNFGAKLLFPQEIEIQEPLANIERAGVWNPELHEDEDTFINKDLNERQKAAVCRILAGLCRPMPYVLFGPPGTGKTITVVEAILQILLRVPSSRILACAPSNSAADLLTERLHVSGLVKPIDMVRLNAFNRSYESIPDSIEAFCKDGSDLEVVCRYRIVVCTCVTAGTLYALNLKQGHFTHTFVDEAGQATEPECMIPVGLAAGEDGQVVLSGDPKQLGPVLQSKLAKEFGLGMSYLERIMQLPPYLRNEDVFAKYGCYNPILVTKLIENYRSHCALLQLPSRLFYHNELQVSGNESLITKFCQSAILLNKEVPLIFHGIRGEDLREGNSPSWFNPMETVKVISYLQEVLKIDQLIIKPSDIGIITPYRKQVEKIRSMMDFFEIEDVKVGSVEEFQGQERLIMIISTVRSDESKVGFDVRHNLGFLSNPKRFNVSITRAQALMIIIGNPFVLCQDEYWIELIEYSVRLHAYKGCSLSGLEALELRLGPDHKTEFPGVYCAENEANDDVMDMNGMFATHLGNSSGTEESSSLGNKTIAHEAINQESADSVNCILVNQDCVLENTKPETRDLNRSDHSVSGQSSDSTDVSLEDTSLMATVLKHLQLNSSSDCLLSKTETEMDELMSEFREMSEYSFSVKNRNIDGSEPDKDGISLGLVKDYAFDIEDKLKEIPQTVSELQKKLSTEKIFGSPVDDPIVEWSRNISMQKMYNLNEIVEESCADLSNSSDSRQEVDSVNKSNKSHENPFMCLADKSFTELCTVPHNDSDSIDNSNASSLQNIESDIDIETNPTGDITSSLEITTSIFSSKCCVENEVYETTDKMDANIEQKIPESSQNTCIFLETIHRIGNSNVNYQLHDPYPDLVSPTSLAGEENDPCLYNDSIEATNAVKKSESDETHILQLGNYNVLKEAKGTLDEACLTQPQDQEMLETNAPTNLETTSTEVYQTMPPSASAVQKLAEVILARNKDCSFCEADCDINCDKSSNTSLVKSFDSGALDKLDQTPKHNTKCSEEPAETINKQTVFNSNLSEYSFADSSEVTMVTEYQHQVYREIESPFGGDGISKDKIYILDDSYYLEQSDSDVIIESEYED